MWIRYFKGIVYSLKHNFRMAFTASPVVVILGSTGTGKSKLALDIAKRFNGEIISADSMQVYKGLNIISNKVTPEERREVPHYMIDVVEPTDIFSVVKFRDSCLKIMEDLHQAGKLPVIVGGTNYYIESVLWHVLVPRALRPSSQPAGSDSQSAESDSQSAQSDSQSSGSEEAAVEDLDALRRRLDGLTTEQMFAMLRERDSRQADVLHPNERRKILRALEVTLQSGVPMSEHLRRQRAVAGGGLLGGPARFSRVCLLWLTADQQLLDVRLDGRVDDMLRRGLLSELKEFHRQFNTARADAHGDDGSYTTGIFQTIGFKEFHEYLTRGESDADAEALLQEGVTRLKIATRQYARRQTRWVRRRFLRAGARHAPPPLYRLDATDPDRWESTVATPARRVVAAWLAGAAPPLRPEPLEPASDGYDSRRTHHCSVCGVYLCGEQQWSLHMASRRHSKALQGRARRHQRDEAAAARDVSGQSPVI